MYHRLEHALQLIKSRSKLVSVGTASALWLAVTVGLALLFVIWDHWQGGGVPAPARTAIRWLYVMGSIGWLVAAVVLPLARHINSLYAARLVERSHPEFRNSVVGALQIARHRELPGSVRAAVIERASRDVTHIDVLTSVSTQVLRQVAAFAVAVVALFCLYAMFSPKPVWPSLLRALGWGLPAPTRTKLAAITPQDGASVLRGEPVSFTACTSGRQPLEVFVRFSLDSGKTWVDGQQLKLLLSHKFGWQEMSWVANKDGRDVQQSMVWQMVAGDANSELRHLIVRPVPEISDINLRYVYPRYTRLPPATQPGGEIDAVVGTKVTITASANVAVRHPVLVVGEPPAEKRRVLAPPSAGAPMQVTAELTVIEDDVYRLEFHDSADAPNRDPIRYPIRARADAAPTVKIERPANQIELQPGAGLSLAAAVQDDFGLTRGLLSIRRAGEEKAVELPLDLNAGKTASRARIAQPVPLTALNPKVGDTFEWWVSAWDNREDMNGRAVNQRGDSDIRRIRISRRNETAEKPPREQSGQKNSDSESASAEGSGEAGESGGTSTAPSDSGETGVARADGGRKSDSKPETVEEFTAAHAKELRILDKHMDKGGGEQGESSSKDGTSTSKDGASSSKGEAAKGEKADADGTDQSGAQASADKKDGSSPGQPAGTDPQQSKGEQQKPSPTSADKPGDEKSADKQDTSLPTTPEEKDNAEKSGPLSGESSADSEQQAGENQDKSADSAEQSEQAQNEMKEGQEPKETSAKSDNDGAAADSDSGESGQGKKGEKGSDGQGQSGKEADKSEQGDGQGENGSGKDGSKGQGKTSGEKQPGGDPKEAGQAGSGSGKGEQTQADSKGEADKSAENSEKGSKPGNVGEGAPNEDKNGNGTAGGGGPSGGQTADVPDKPAQPEVAGEKPVAPDYGRDRLMPPGRVERIVDALEQSLRQGQVDPGLLDELNWNIPHAREFVKDYQRLADRGQKQVGQTDVPGEVSETTANGNSDKRILRSSGPNEPNLKRMNTTVRRSPDATSELMETGRQKVAPRYRPVLEAYYRSVASAPAP